ncbi:MULTISPECIES: DUF397 domain-containing protein [unclassified Streptomyces]|uniref:DUF397 domain-containing protein n=1 Tax=unclassified Streptomyces TaxID=2593676 RepID=UPI002ED45340|nr:DUF397 domain-containing protein [Streptomyces sp. NBC_00891]WSY07377.1 DUF397 domain-containing protein [Streptomyces sp. NBC_00890]WSZ09002.1 DUF397 domain-containing protein [Streptomyces sp. NBC_00869]WSZ23499.1 DUF397 domain-containing protein [Streptomyces sp. NBC_00870]
MSTEPIWHRSSYSGSGGDNCVEVTLRPEAIQVRDSKDTALPPLTVSAAAWSNFTVYASAVRTL